MGNSITECMRTQQLNKGEMNVTKDESSISEEYLKKTTPDDTLKQLLSRKLKEDQQPRSYTKGSVKVTIL
ncbi:hypothetical protein SteCoe_18782 [Stentor coeruleus]|uniref:Uncharacterized protein n=1 Tax=Stentor coeruleus TaxID=5963 RepID=A0A1R2BVN1_9CILI|nr:hypothetical protein SteCoe_18782 [Stentor coeruleus]